MVLMLLSMDQLRHIAYNYYIQLIAAERASLKRASAAAVLIAAAASEPEASEQGSYPNLYMWVKISILPLAHCIMVPIGFYRGLSH